MKILNNWTEFEKVFLLVSILSVIIVSIIFKSDSLTVICSIVGIISILLIARGKNSGQIWGVIYTVLYSIISFYSNYYGEVIVYTLFMLPMFVAGIIAWYKHKNIETDSVEINVINKIEWLIVFLAVPGLSIGMYYLLKAFNTEELILSTISALSDLLGIYLQIRRARSSFIFYIINDITLVLLWGVPLLNGNYTLFPLFLNVIFIFIDNLYGLYNWKKLIKLQNK